MISKTIIISQQEGKGRGILTLFLEDGLLKAKLRLYEFNPLSADCKLAIYHNNQVYSANLILKNGAYCTSFVGDFDINADFYAAIVAENANNAILLSGGSYAGYFFNDESVFAPHFNEKEQLSTQPIDESDLYNTPAEELNDILPEENSLDIDEQPCNTGSADECFGNCRNCKYKEYFYSHQPADDDEEAENSLTRTDETSNLAAEMAAKEAADNLESMAESLAEKPTIPTEQPTTPTAPTLLESLLPQFDYIFENYQPNAELNALLEDSKFVSIDENGESYSIGAIYENQQMKYICYAVKCSYNTPAPEELGKCYQWLPLDAQDPLSDGYYIVYQDAKDLKIIEV